MATDKETSTFGAPVEGINQLLAFGLEDAPKGPIESILKEQGIFEDTFTREGFLSAIETARKADEGDIMAQKTILYKLSQKAMNKAAEMIEDDGRIIWANKVHPITAYQLIKPYISLQPKSK